MRDDFFHRKTFNKLFKRNLRGGAGGGFTADTGAETMGTARPPRNLLTSSSDSSTPGFALVRAAARFFHAGASPLQGKASALRVALLVLLRRE